MKFDVIAQEWFHSKVGLVKDSTLSAYYQQLRSHILPYWKDMDVESFKKNDAQLFIGQKFQERLVDENGEGFRDYIKTDFAICRR